MTYLLNVPLKQKLNNGYERYFFREAMKGILPESIRYRKRKADLSPLFYKKASKIMKKILLKGYFLKKIHLLMGIFDKKQF